MLHLEDMKSSRNLERMPFHARECTAAHGRTPDPLGTLPGGCHWFFYEPFSTRTVLMVSSMMTVSSMTDRCLM